MNSSICEIREYYRKTLETLKLYTGYVMQVHQNISKKETTFLSFASVICQLYSSQFEGLNKGRSARIFFFFSGSIVLCEI